MSSFIDLTHLPRAYFIINEDANILTHKRQARYVTAKKFVIDQTLLIRKAFLAADSTEKNGKETPI